MSTLLVIDDDRLNCDMLQSVFSRQGYDVMTAANGQEGLQVFHRINPRVTLIDLRMPGMDGLEVLKEIRAHNPAAGVVLLGGGPTEEQENQARELRVTDFFRKGLSLDMLLEVVQHISGQGTPDSRAGMGLLKPGQVLLEETILVVEDNALVRGLLMRFLSLRGYRVEGAADGEQALDKAVHLNPDLIVLDLSLPRKSGLEVLRSLRQREYPGGIIILADSRDEQVLKEAWAMHPREVLGRPVDLERLYTTVQLVMVCREC